MGLMLEKKFKKVDSNSLQEIYNWYREIKRPTYVWASILEMLFMTILSCIVLAIIVGIPMYFINNYWGKVTVDTRFTAIVTFIIFIIGIFIGRKSKQKSGGTRFK